MRSRRGRSARRTTRTPTRAARCTSASRTSRRRRPQRWPRRRARRSSSADKVATTFFYSTSGGQTESSVDWTGTALPYLVSVPDPYDDISPYHNWGPVPVTAQTISKALKVTGPITDATTVANAAGRVGKLNLVTPLAPQTVSAATLRSAIGLRSTWFTVGVMSLSAPVPSAPVAVRLAAHAHRHGARRVERHARAAPARRNVATGRPGRLRRPQADAEADDDDRLPPRDRNGRSCVRADPGRAGDPGDDVHDDAGRGLRAAARSRPRPCRCSSRTPTEPGRRSRTGVVNADGTFSLPVTLTSGGTYRVSVGPATGYTAGTTPPQVVMH